METTTSTPATAGARLCGSIRSPTTSSTPAALIASTAAARAGLLGASERTRPRTATPGRRVRATAVLLPSVPAAPATRTVLVIVKHAR